MQLVYQAPDTHNVQLNLVTPKHCYLGTTTNPCLQAFAFRCFQVWAPTIPLHPSSPQAPLRPPPKSHVRKSRTTPGRRVRFEIGRGGERGALCPARRAILTGASHCDSSSCTARKAKHPVAGGSLRDSPPPPPPPVKDRPLWTAHPPIFQFTTCCPTMPQYHAMPPCHPYLHGLCVCRLNGHVTGASSDRVMRAC